MRIFPVFLISEANLENSNPAIGGAPASAKYKIPLSGIFI
jgi:hypothetical protein